MDKLITNTLLCYCAIPFWFYLVIIFLQNEILEKSEKNSDKFGSQKSNGEKVSADVEDIYENIFDFKEFEEVNKKNDLAKSDSFGKFKRLERERKT